ncbi:MAG: sigma-70 family RNA polymerase sigma factor [Clostridia bacterium]|nr:sigma-70 family RNA polymerase sigma factor [Clostridia bacterium]MBQ4618702.1 sigma-70 family RNA polymerase sigma factor [Clostridia bacterium]
MQRDDDRLVDAALGGDMRAFELLMEKHESKMYAVALRMCANREDAQDCLQDAMLRIYKALPSFKGQSSFSTWAYRITMNTCLDELRRKKVRQAASLDQMLEVGWSPVDEENSTERHVDNQELKRNLSKAIQTLPEEMRAAVVLRDVQGFSYDEIASMLSTNVGTVKSRISRGREKLREILSKDRELFGISGV